MKTIWKLLTRNSATVIWARLMSLVALALITAQESPYLDMVIRTWIEPESAPIILLVLGVVTELARSRTLNK